MKIQSKKLNYCIIGGLLFLIVGTGVIISLMSSPFGLMFKTGFYLAITGLIIILFTLCYRLFKKLAIWKKLVAFVLSLIPLILLIVTLIILLDVRIFFFQGLPPKLTNDQWREDLHFLSEEMIHNHPKLTQTKEIEILEEEVARLDEKIDILTDNQIAFEFNRVLATLNDVHSVLANQPFNPNWHIFPLKTYFFGNNLHVVGTGKGNEDLIGAEILKIGDHSIIEIYQKLSAYVCAENEYGKKNHHKLLITEYLKAAGFIGDTQNVKFTFETTEGESIERFIRAVSFFNYTYWIFQQKVEKTISPTIPNDRLNNYWVEYQQEKELIYFQFNKTIITEDKPLKQFINEIDDIVNSVNFKSFVIDLRMNTGGNAGMIKPLANYIINNDKINKKGKLYVLIGRKTFSGGVLFASILRNNSKAIFVGEPTSQGPLYHALPKLIVLPNSKLYYAISTTLVKTTVDEIPMPWITPDIAVNYTCDDFLSGNNPLLDFISENKLLAEESLNTVDAIPENFIGRYLYSPYEILSIKYEGTNLCLSISNFNDRSYSNINTGLYTSSEATTYSTDIPRLSCSFINENKGEIIIRWGENEKVLRMLDENYMLPIELLNVGKILEAINGFRNYDKKIIEHIPGLETKLNGMGYDYLGKDDSIIAIELFKLNVELFPDSWNAWDSLAETYKESGDKELAIKCYKKSIALNPNNLNGIRILEELLKN